MNENDIQYLEKALINEKNEDIINQTFQEIDKNKENILNELELSKIDTKNLLKKLDDYKYIDEYPDFLNIVYHFHSFILLYRNCSI